MKIALIIVLGVLLAVGALSILVVIGAGKCERDLLISKSYENQVGRKGMQMKNEE